MRVRVYILIAAAMVIGAAFYGGSAILGQATSTHPVKATTVPLPHKTTHSHAHTTTTKAKPDPPAYCVNGCDGLTPIEAGALAAKPAGTPFCLAACGGDEHDTDPLEATEDPARELTENEATEHTCLHGAHVSGPVACPAAAGSGTAANTNISGTEGSSDEPEAGEVCDPKEPSEFNEISPPAAGPCTSGGAPLAGASKGGGTSPSNPTRVAKNHVTVHNNKVVVHQKVVVKAQPQPQPAAATEPDGDEAQSDPAPQSLAAAAPQPVAEVPAPQPVAAVPAPAPQPLPAAGTAAFSGAAGSGAIVFAAWYYLRSRRRVRQAQTKR